MYIAGVDIGHFHVAPLEHMTTFPLYHVLHVFTITLGKRFSTMHTFSHMCTHEDIETHRKSKYRPAAWTYSGLIQLQYSTAHSVFLHKFTPGQV